MSYQIITDSCCDLTEQQLQELNVTCANLTVMYNGENHTSFSEPTAVKAFYDEVRGGGMATTAAANPDDWAQLMKSALEEGKDVLVITFSGGMSTTYQSAVIAASELKEKYPDRKILVVDSLAASLGQGLLVWYACKKHSEGMSFEELGDWCENNKLNLCHWFTVDDLMFLKRGGRISAATALVGTMLQIKPVLHVDDEGHLINVAKARGRKASIEALAKKVGETGLPGENETVFISHGDCIEDVKILENILKEKYGVKNVFTYYVGAVIGSHSGPGTIALFFLGSKR